MTTSGITGIGGNQDIRTGQSNGQLSQSWNGQALQTDVTAQASIMSTAGSASTKAWGDFANTRYLDAIKNEDKEAAECWAPNGPCRGIGHVAIGGLSGGVEGAIGAGVSSMAGPELQAYLVQQGVPPSVANVLTVVGATGAGALLGGGAGAAAAGNEAANNLVMAAPLIYEGILAGGALAARWCMSNLSCVMTIGSLGAAAIGVVAAVAGGDNGQSGADTPAETPTDGVKPPTEEAPFPANPDNSKFPPIKGTGAKVNPEDGSVWERDTSGHGGDQWKRWPDRKSWERRDTPNSVWPDGRVRK